MTSTYSEFIAAHPQLEAVLENDKIYESMAEKSSPIYPNIKNALAVVQDFIKSKNRVLYGGMAIDFALKKSGHKGLYGPEVIPDYDFMSPDFFQDSIELADIFHKAGFESISAINARHVNTRRVRISFIPVADISYMPHEIYKNLPTLEYEGMRFVHPDFQRMDLHRELSYPFEGSPLEVVHFRTRKGIKRFSMIDKQYPIGLTKIGKKTIQPWLKTESITSKLKISDISFSDKKENSVLLTGFYTYAVLYDILNVLFFQKGSDTKIGKIIKKLGIIDEKAVASFKKVLPVDVKWGVEEVEFTFSKEFEHFPLVLVSDYPEEVVVGISETPKNFQKYNRWMDDIKPVHYVANSETCPKKIYDNFGKKIPYFKLNEAYAFAGLKIPDVRTATPHYALLYFLQQYFESNSSNKNFKDPKLLYLYYSLSKVITIAGNAYLRILENPDKELKEMLAKEFYPFLPFFLTSQVYGTASRTPDYETYIIDTNANIKNIPKEARDITRPIFGYYPGSSDHQTFDPKSSKFFSMDGSLDS